MNTLVISNHGNAVKVNPETLEVTDVVYDWASIDRAYLIDEDCDVVIRQKNEEPTKVTTKKGDIVLLFYPREGYKSFAIIQNEDYAYNLMQHRIEEEKRNKACGDVCDICNACADCNTCEAA